MGDAPLVFLFFVPLPCSHMLSSCCDDYPNLTIMSCTNLIGNAGLFLHRRKAELLDPLRKVGNLLNSLVREN
jgi:hypothetical protein